HGFIPVSRLAYDAHFRVGKQRRQPRTHDFVIIRNQKLYTHVIKPLLSGRASFEKRRSSVREPPRQEGNPQNARIFLAIRVLLSGLTVIVAKNGYGCRGGRAAELKTHRVFCDPAITNRAAGVSPTTGPG